MGSALIGEIKLTDLTNATWIKDKPASRSEHSKASHGSNIVAQKSEPAPIGKPKSEKPQSQAPASQAKFKALVDQVSRARSSEMIESSAAPEMSVSEQILVTRQESAAESPKAPIGQGNAKAVGEIEVPEA